MKILILANNDVGLYLFRKELIEELLIDNEVVISLPNGELVEPLKRMGCVFVDTPINRRSINPASDLKLFYSYKKLLKREEPNLVISYTIKPNIYGGYACRLAKVPYAINITGLGTAFENDGLLRKVVTSMYKVVCKKAQVVFFENEDNRQLFIKERIVKGRQTHLLNGAGVNLERYQVSEYPKGDIIRFLFMGRVMAEKGINELFVAMNKLVTNGIKCELDVLGELEEDYKEIIDKYQSEGWLHYYGFQKDVAPYIRKCHCFVLPSWHEGMANTNLESAAMGRPVITSNIPGCREAIVNGKTGFLVERKNAENLYSIMKKFCELPYEDRKTMGLEGRKHIEMLFDKKIVVADTVKTLKENR